MLFSGLMEAYFPFFLKMSSLMDNDSGARNHCTRRHYLLKDLEEFFKYV